VLSNIDIAELLAQQAERETGGLSRALRRAARSAFLWPEEVSDLVAQNRSLTELRSIGWRLGEATASNCVCRLNHF